MFQSLVRCCSEDPGWPYKGSGGEAANLIGPAGAWVSEIAFQLFGVMAYLLPALLAFRALQVLRTYILHEANEFDSWTFALRIVGFILVMISATSLAYIQYEDISHLYPQGMGGILGHHVGQAIISVFSYTGSTVLLLATLLFGLTFFAEISWIGVIDKLGLLTIIGLAS